MVRVAGRRRRINKKMALRGRFPVDIARQIGKFANLRQSNIIQMKLFE